MPEYWLRQTFPVHEQLDDHWASDKLRERAGEEKVKEWLGGCVWGMGGKGLIVGPRNS